MRKNIRAIELEKFAGSPQKKAQLEIGVEQKPYTRKGEILRMRSICPAS